MLQEFLLPETTVREAGAGSEIDLGGQVGGTLLLTLGITRIIEQQSIDISIWGSADGTDWGAKPVASFPQKFYCAYARPADTAGTAAMMARWAGPKRWKSVAIASGPQPGGLRGRRRLRVCPTYCTCASASASASSSAATPASIRSEEHTSELQSLRHLV